MAAFLSPLQTSATSQAATAPSPSAPEHARKARFWDRVARKYATDPIADVPGYERSLARTMDHLEPSSHVLEVGCGTGTTALRLAPCCERYVATDVSSEMIAIANEKLALAPSPSLRFALADADAVLDAVEGPFDRVLGFNVLHLVENLDVALSACAAALVPHGLLITKTPCLREMNWFVPNLVVPIARAFGKAPPVLNLSEADLVGAMRRHGLTVLAVERHASKGRDMRPWIVARKPRSRTIEPASNACA